MKVKFAHAKNPDIAGGYWTPPIDAGRAHWINVESLEEASDFCRAYIARNELGSGNWTGGEVKDQGKTIARISYNGRIWPEKTEAP